MSQAKLTVRLAAVVFVTASAGVLFAVAPSLGKAKPSPSTKQESTMPDKAARLKQLTPMQVQVTQQCGTEPPFRNEYWDNHRAGIYVDIVSGEPLFLSKDKFDSGTGWPSFTRPIDPTAVTSQGDDSHGMSRVEVRSKQGDSHLGHLFDDGPGPTHQRYCINSASLRFVPIERMADEGYGQYLPLLGVDSPRTAAKSVSKAVATLAGGCFWGMEELLRKLPGVMAIEAGYTGGTTEDPDYDQVHSGRTGHAEAVEITYDPRVLSYESILRYFFRLHDPTTVNRQGNDVGSQYRSAIFVHDDEQRRVAERVKAEVDASGKWPKPVVTQVVPAAKFYRAEDDHQDYLQKHPSGYTCHYLRD